MRLDHGALVMNLFTYVFIFDVDNSSPRYSENIKNGFLLLDREQQMMIMIVLMSQKKSSVFTKSNTKFCLI